ncbi:MAG: error-prone DNA polymerase [Labilithrix sp.]|nr:error-prone DNA polymerase [Labilithrix sp.]MCW5814381.1 error-prone DNA polymerase [Labilithrix sp.]
MPYEDAGTSERAASPHPAIATELAQLRASIAARTSRYVELTARTNFSFLSGATPPERMVFRAAELGYDAIGIADRDGLYGVVRAHEEAQKQGIRLVVGCELTLEREGLEGVPEIPGKPTTITVFVESREGYANLCKILTESHARHPKNLPLRRTDGLDEEDLPKNTFAGLPLSYVSRHAAGLWALADAALLDEPAGREAIRAFGARLSIAVHLHKDGEDRVRVMRAEAAARTHGLPICATNRVLYARPQDKPILDVLHCIREGKTLDEAGRELGPNAEAHLKNEEEMTRLFSLHPEWLARARFVADRCTFSLKELKYDFPYEITDLVHRDFRHPDGRVGETADEALRRLTYDGARARWGEAIPANVAQQIEKELTLITQLAVAPYFLSVRAVVDMARRRDILCQGRGSAANSAVCFCLGITAVDPARSNLLFERFLSAERREPPDIDVDFEHERREEVIQEIYETYGRDRAAMVCEIVSYRSKSALREVGKAFGFSLEQIDRLAGVVTWWDGISAVSESRLKAIGFSADDPRVRQVIVMARAVQGFPRHLSIHVGGFVLSAKPLSAVAPIEPATMDKRTIIPWDKDDIDTLGFFKIDVLGLGMLTAIRKCLDLVRGVAEVTPGYAAPPLLAKSAIERLAHIPPEDPKVFDALCNADTVGVFQIESRAQMAMLPRLKPREFYDLVIEVAIVRPGPIQGGMVHPYLRRRCGEEEVKPPHPILAPILERTLGVPLFQEQVMQIAIVGAGYSGGEADRLRRDMAAWRKNGNLERHRERLLQGFRERGIPEEFGERLYQQIHGFAEYGFPESHSCSFSLLVYSSSWLKLYYPAEFAAALINSQPMGFYSPSTILQDAQRHGVELLPVDINKSVWNCTCEGPDLNEGPQKRPRMRARSAPSAPREGRVWGGGVGGEAPDVESTKLRLGLRVVAGLGEDAGRRIEAGRPYASAGDVLARARLDRKEAMALAESGALDALSDGGRRGAIWDVVAPRPEDMFVGTTKKERSPELVPMTRAEQLVLDYERTGISVSDHPLKLLRSKLGKRFKSSLDVLGLRAGTRVKVAGLVTCRQRPGTASGVVFVTMEDEHGFLNLVLWPRVFEKYRLVATTSKVLIVHGKIERSDDPKGLRPPDPNVPQSVLYVVAEHLEAFDEELPKLASMSRDFH